MPTPSTTLIWLSEQAGPLALIVVLLAFVMIVLYLSARNRRVRLNQARSGANEATFVESMRVAGFDPAIAKTVYRYLQEHQNVRFPIQSEDLLDEDLGLDLVDVDQTVRDVLKLTNREYKPGLKHTPLATVHDLVLFVQHSPRLVDRAA